MKDALGWVIISINLPVAAVTLFAVWRDWPSAWPLIAAANGLSAVAQVLQSDWPMVAVNGVCALLALWMWWRRRRNRGRLRAALSGKYRHVRDAMVRTLRDRRVARPVLAPGRAS